MNFKEIYLQAQVLPSYYLDRNFFNSVNQKADVFRTALLELVDVFIKNANKFLTHQDETLDSKQRELLEEIVKNLHQASEFLKQGYSSSAIEKMLESLNVLDDNDIFPPNSDVLNYLQTAIADHKKTLVNICEELETQIQLSKPEGMIDEQKNSHYSSKSYVNIFKINDLPFQVDEKDLDQDGFLLSKIFRERVIEYFYPIDSDGKQAPTEINFKLPFNVRRYGNCLVALYYSDKKHYLGEGLWGKVKLGQVIYVRDENSHSEKEEVDEAQLTKICKYKAGDWVAVKNIKQEKKSPSFFENIIAAETNGLMLTDQAIGFHLLEKKSGQKGSIAMALANGPNLNDWLTDENSFGFPKLHLVPQQRILHIITNMAKAVQIFHRMNLLHLDIKPINMQFDPRSGAVKLVDMGLVCHAAKNDVLVYDTRVGTQTNFAPEICEGFINTEGQKIFNYSHLVDIYALAISIAQLLQLVEEKLVKVEEGKVLSIDVISDWDKLKRPLLLPDEIMKPIYDFLKIMTAKADRPDIESVVDKLEEIEQQALPHMQSQRKIIAIVNCKLPLFNKDILSQLIACHEVKIEIPSAKSKTDMHKYSQMARQLQNLGVNVTELVHAPDKLMERPAKILSYFGKIKQYSDEEKGYEYCYLSKEKLKADECLALNKHGIVTLFANDENISENVFKNVIDDLYNVEDSLLQQMLAAEKNKKNNKAKRCQQKLATIKLTRQLLSEFHRDGNLTQTSVFEMLQAAQNKLSDIDESKNGIHKMFKTLKLEKSSNKELDHIRSRFNHRF